MADKKWRHDELASDLARSLAKNEAVMVWEDMQLGPSGSARPDVYVIKKSYTNFTPITYEIKVSRSDFLSDVTSGKWQKYLKFSSGVIFAVPSGLIKKDEVPTGCGLIVRTDNVWRTLKRPTMERLNELPHSAYMKLLIDGGRRITETEKPIRVKPDPSIWVVNQKIRDKFGKEVAALLHDIMASRQAVIEERQRNADLIKELNAERNNLFNDRLERAKENLAANHSQLSRFCKDLGIEPDCSQFVLRSKLQSLRNAIDENYHISTIKTALSQIKESASALEEDQLSKLLKNKDDPK